MASRWHNIACRKMTCPSRKTVSTADEAQAHKADRPCRAKKGMLPETMMGLLRVTMVAVLSIGEITCASAAMASRQSTSADSWPASATILDSAQAPLPVVTPISSPGNVINPLEGKPLRNLIGIDFSGRSDEGEITEVSYNTTKPTACGISVQYCNLFDEENTGRYGPYLHTSDTAAQYGEGQIDPHGPGWEKNLREQFERRSKQGFE